MPPLLFRPAIVDQQNATEIIRGLWTWDVPGVRIFLPFVTADPLKDSEDWWEASRDGMPANEHAREYGVDFGVFAGKPVYPEYQDRFHLWPASKGPLKYLTTRPIIRGWDVPGPLACVWLQIVPIPRANAAKTDDPPIRLHVLAELMADCSVVEFGRQVQSISSTTFPQMHAGQFLDWGDPAAFAKQVNDKVSAREKLVRECGIHLQPGPITRNDRQEPVRRWLQGLMTGAPYGEPSGKVLVDSSCVRLQAALKGGYHYKEIEKGSGRYRDIPEKNAWSHLAEAFEYGVSRADAPTPHKDAAEEKALEMRHYLGRVR